MAVEDPQRRADGGPQPGSTTGITARLAVYKSGYARFTDSSYEAIGVDRSLIDAVALWTDSDKIGIRLHATEPSPDRARDHPAITTGSLPDNAVKKQSDGKFPIDPVLRDMFGVDASMADGRFHVTATWLEPVRMWKIDAPELARPLDVSVEDCDV